MPSIFVATGPRRLELVQPDTKHFAGNQELGKFVSLSELSECLSNLNNAYDYNSDPTVLVIVRNYLMPYSAVIPQTVRLLDSPSTAFDLKHCRPEHYGNLAVSEGFAMDVMRAISRNCYAFAVVDGTTGAPKATLVALQSRSSDGDQGPIHVISMENLKR
jgi:hypothetical protein